SAEPKSLGEPSFRSECALELRARHEDETPRPFRVRLVEGEEEATGDEAREDRLGRIRCVDDDLAAVGEAKHVNRGADDVHRKVSPCTLELRGRSEFSPHRPAGGAPAAPEVENGEPRALENDELRPVECRAEDSRSAAREASDAAAGIEDADPIAVADDGNPAGIERGDGRLPWKRPDDRLSSPADLPDVAQAYADISAPIDSEDADVESDRGPVPHKPAEERTGKLLSVRLDDLHRAACRRPHKPERVVG